MNETKIVWHPYPDEKPESYTKEYLLTVETHYGKHRVKKIRIDTWCDSIGGGEWEEFDNSPDSVAIAWAELPEPYKEPELLDMHQDAITARKYMEKDPEAVKALHIFDEE